MTAFSRPNSCELKNLSNCNEFELISLSKYLKHQYQLAENEPDYTSMLNIYLNLYLDLTNTVYDYKDKHIEQILQNIKTIYEEKLKDIEDEIKKKQEERLHSGVERPSEKKIQITKTAISEIKNKSKYGDVYIHGQGIKKRKKTKGKKTKGKKSKGKKTKGKKTKGNNDVDNKLK